MTDRRTCSIDKNSKKMDWVARRHLEGFTPNKMEVMAREAGMPMKRETIQRHLRECVGTDMVGEEVAEAAAAVVPPHGGNQTSGDVATLVQEQVVEKLRDGEARVTVQHGLQAQQLLDRRAERAKDRELAVTLARLLHSPAPPEEAIRHRQLDAEVVIEGEAVEVGN